MCDHSYVASITSIFVETSVRHQLRIQSMWGQQLISSNLIDKQECSQRREKLHVKNNWQRRKFAWKIRPSQHIYLLLHVCSNSVDRGDFQTRHSTNMNRNETREVFIKHFVQRNVATQDMRRKQNGCKYADHWRETLPPDLNQCQT